MDRIEPKDLLGLLHRFDRKIDNHRLIVTANDHAFERFASAGIDLLVRHERRYIDEIAGTGFGYELQPFSPAHAGFAAHHVNDTLELPVMMGAGLGVWLYAHRASPNLLRPDPRLIDRSLALHARRLRGVGIKRRRGDDPHAIVLPFGRLPVIICERHGNHPDCLLHLRWLAAHCLMPSHLARTTSA